MNVGSLTPDKNAQRMDMAGGKPSGWWATCTCSNAKQKHTVRLAVATLSKPSTDDVGYLGKDSLRLTRLRGNPCLSWSNVVVFLYSRKARRTVRCTSAYDTV